MATRGNLAFTPMEWDSRSSVRTRDERGLVARNAHGASRLLRRGCRLPLPCFRVSLLLHLSHLSPDPGVLVCHAQLDFVAEPALFRQLLFHICFKLRDLGMHFALRVLVNRRHELTVHSDVVVSQLTILA